MGQQGEALFLQSKYLSLYALATISCLDASMASTWASNEQHTHVRGESRPVGLLAVEQGSDK
ncbi:unnamed protein product [Prunus armeniaca]